MKIGIVYIAIGKYEKFWDIFYPTCQTFFCVDAEKGYELFTDSERLLNLDYPNVTAHKVIDNGFIMNVSSKSKYMLSIERQLQKYDYIFYLNGNFRFLSPIYSREVVSFSKDFAFTALSFYEYLNKPLEELPYDRNPQCGAYIAKEKGKRYYQGGFFGGTIEEIMKFNRWAAQAIERDLRNSIIARFHDESYLNKYLLDKEPQIVGNEYAYYPATTYKGSYKAELIDKTTFFGRDKLFDIRDKYFQADYSFLLDENTEFNRLGIISMTGGLGNQLFILAFYSYLKDVLKVEQRLYLDLSLYNHFHFHSGFELKHLFGINNDIFLTDKLKKSISAIPSTVISEENNSVFQKLEPGKSNVTYYYGYWQCAKYANSNKAALREFLKFDESKLTDKASFYLYQIKDADSPVSIHIRRGDYLNNKNSLIFYNLSDSDYYLKAIDSLNSLNHSDHTFFMFSDDTEWVKAHFDLNNMVVVESNKKNAPWQDLFLMTQCKHNIISNSSFAWWGAWLNENPDKIVIAPGNWYNGVDVPDLYPDDWVILEKDNGFSFQEKMATHLLLKDYKLTYPGLLGGKMGLCIYLFQTARFSQNDKYEIIASDLLEEIYNNIFFCQNYDFGKQGLFGVAAGLQYLIQEKYVEGSINEVLLEIDTSVVDFINENPSLSPHQLLDFLEYIFLRTKNNRLLDEFLENRLLYDVARILLLQLEKQVIQNKNDGEKMIYLLHKLRLIKPIQENVEDVLFRLMNEETLRKDYLNNHIKHQLQS